jgi:hypothetical protein
LGGDHQKGTDKGVRKLGKGSDQQSIIIKPLTSKMDNRTSFLLRNLRTQVE